MINAIIRSALRYRMLVLMISAAMLAYGTYLATRLPIDIFPDLDRPRVVILTECFGLATEEVESLVSQPIEIALLGANGVEAVRSHSTAGLNVIFVEFGWSIDVRIARQTVQERLSTVSGVLPDGIRPQMTPTTSIMGQIVLAGMYRQPGPKQGALTKIEGTDLLAELVEESDSRPQLFVWRTSGRRDPTNWEVVVPESIHWRELSSTESGGVAARVEVTLDGRAHYVDFPTELQQQMSLRTMADWIIRPRMMKIPGIAEVFVQGGERKQYQVLVDPSALLEYDVTLQDVERALQESNINASGGFAIGGESERPIRIIGRLGPEPAAVVQELGQVPVKRNPTRPVLLGQVATIIEGPQLKRGDGSVNGRPGVVFTIAKQPHVDTRQVTDLIDQAFREAESALPPDIVVHADLFRLKNFIDRGIFNVGEALVLGAIMVVAILFLFLLNLRTTFITLTAIPLSLVMTTLVLRWISHLFGTPLSINVMTLGGIAVAMGELVDDAIVDVENIFRRLRENNAAPNPQPALRVVYEASREIRSAIVFGTAVVVVVFLPLFALSGVEGRLFAPLGIAYIVSILASLAVSLTVTPVLSYYLLPQSKATHRGEGPLLRVLKRWASRLIHVSMAHAGKLLVATWMLFGVAIWQLASLGRDFLPPFDEGSMLVMVNLPSGYSLEASNAASRLIDAKFREMQATPDRPDGEVLHFVRRTGRAEMDEHAAPVTATEYIVSMNPAARRTRDEMIGDLLADLREQVPGVDIEVEQPLAHLISHMISGVYAQIAIKVYGEDLEALQKISERIKSTVQQVPGVTPPIVDPIQKTAELQIRLRPDDLAYYGLTRAYVAQVLQTALQGEVVSQVLEGRRRFDLLVRLEEAYRTDFANLGRLRIDLPNNEGQVELRELAEISEGLGAHAVNRENAQRRAVIRCNTQGRDLASAVAEIKQKIEQNVPLPEGYLVELSGQFESQERATTLIAVLAGVSIIAMFVILLVLFPSVRITLQILNALPTAFIGGVAALLLTQQSLSVASLVGFISLGGIAVRNGILLVTHYFHLMEFEGEEFTPQMVMRGSLERLAPVLMTALTAGFALLPLIVGGQAPGREILYPVATVIVGGLVTSTFCEFLLHPGLFWKFSGKDAIHLILDVEKERHVF